MTEWVSERNRPIVVEFRGNGGSVGGAFEGRPLLLLHHRGIRTGREYVVPLGYLAHTTGPDEVLYVFASNSGQAQDPHWYRNVMATGQAEVEVGTDRYRVAVVEVIGPERDRLEATQAQLSPAISASVQRTAGIRVIPVLSLRQ